MSKLILLVIGFILPPLAVALQEGLGSDLLINIILTCLGWLPGWLHAWWIILRD